MIVFEYFNKYLKIPKDQIIIYGRSIGSGPAIHLASLKKDICALIVVSAFTSIKDVVKNQVGKILSIFIRNRFNNLKRISEIKAPCLLIHGEQDELIPVDHCKKLYQACKSKSVDKDIKLFHGMNHNDYDEKEHLLKPLKTFLKRVKNSKKTSIDIQLQRISFKIDDDT